MRGIFFAPRGHASNSIAAAVPSVLDSVVASTADRSTLRPSDVPGDDEGSASSDDRIARWLQHLDREFARSKRVATLQLARELIVSNMYDIHAWNQSAALGHTELSATLPEALSALRTASEAFRSVSAAARARSPDISVNAYRLVSLLYDLVTQAVHPSCPAATSVLFLTTARDAVYLFISVTPVHSGQQLATIPHLSMLFYNDCLFLSHHLLALQNQFLVPFRARVSHPSAVVDAAVPPAEHFEHGHQWSVLVDLVGPVRALGAKFISSLLSSQREAVFDVLRQFPTVADLAESKAVEAAMSCVKQILHLSQRLQKAWKVMFSIFSKHSQFLQLFALSG